MTVFSFLYLPEQAVHVLIRFLSISYWIYLKNILHYLPALDILAQGFWLDRLLIHV